MGTEATERRQRGRPKTTGASGRAEEIRREQIRSAQRAYRLRKGDKMRDLEAAHAELTAKCEAMENSLFAICEEATKSSFLMSQPETALAVMIQQSSSHFFNNRLLASPDTYSFLESSFARRVQRRSLELAYQVFDNPTAEPQSVYRIFRLVSCFKDREKMKPYFQRLLQAGKAQCLELYGLPFYCVGGASKHYLRPNAAGVPETPLNLRLPKRLLGIVSCDAETYAKSLERMGYGGTWLDSYEVERYLREQGIVPQPCSVMVPVQQSQSSVQSRPKLHLDINAFLERICRDFSILGRAPGFRRDSVDAAIKEGLRSGYDSFSAP